ncbi:hypothetical protein Slin15195_G062390 [Septoria linicola]|uniref:Uncharacterized protein n=1 Tax=Septoria linicola TaxID=215465 RepID=A0A9Q9EJD8_9PEZI|nr:hypothetical protein Slin14017_G078200 [Septoria linicola]USW52920.1 hypothetical protein Slin15195_G062390 [Septoria linicola]
MACMECILQAGTPNHVAELHQTHSRTNTQETLFDRLSTRLSRIPENLAQYDASDYLSEIQDLVCDTYQLSSDRPDSSSPMPRRVTLIHPNSRLSTRDRLQNTAIDQTTFTSNLIKRLSLTRRLSTTTPNTLPPAIETFFEANTILIKKSAALLPGMSSALSEQLHPLLSLNIRNLELHIKLSFRPLCNNLQLPSSTSKQDTFEVKPEHISHIATHLPLIASQLPRLNNLIIVLDSLFDLPPRPRDYQRFLRTHHYHAGATREEHIRSSDLEEKIRDVVVPCLRRTGKQGKLGRIAVKHASVMGIGKEEVEVVNGVSCSDEDVARAVVGQQGREVVLKGWL